MGAIGNAIYGDGGYLATALLTLAAIAAISTVYEVGRWFYLGRWSRVLPIGLRVTVDTVRFRKDYPDATTEDSKRFGERMRKYYTERRTA